MTVAMALLCGTWSLLTPQFLSPDESAHFATSVRVSEGFTWPDPATARFPAATEAAQEERLTPHDQRSTLAELLAAHPGTGERIDQMTQHPPLYYLVSGGALAMPGVEHVTWDQAMLVVRLLGALLAAPLVWLSWNAVATLLRSRPMGIVAAGAVFAVPQLPQTMGAITNDSLAILVAWCVTWLSIKVMRGDRRLRTLLALGVAFGVGCLVKGTVLPLGLLLLLAPWFGEGRADGWRRLRESALTLGVAFAVGGWWWARNILRYGTPQPDGLVVESPGWAPGETPDVTHYIDEVWRVTPTSFWGWFGRVSVPLSNVIVDLLTISCLLLLVLGLFRRGNMRPYAAALATPAIATVLLFLRTSWAAYAEGGVVRGLHGRYFFTILLLLIALAAIAAANLVRSRASRAALAGAVAVGAAALTLLSLAIAFLGFYGETDPSAWREALRTWTHLYSPLPQWATLGVTGGALLGVIVGSAAMLRTALSERTEVRDGTLDTDFGARRRDWRRKRKSGAAAARR